jgi:hypothetical protein
MCVLFCLSLWKCGGFRVQSCSLWFVSFNFCSMSFCMKKLCHALVCVCVSVCVFLNFCSMYFCMKKLCHALLCVCVCVCVCVWICSDEFGVFNLKISASSYYCVSQILLCLLLNGHWFHADWFCIMWGERGERNHPLETRDFIYLFFFQTKFVVFSNKKFLGFFFFGKIVFFPKCTIWLIFLSFLKKKCQILDIKF